MNRNLLIFGASGSLGRKFTGFMMKENFHRIYTFSRRPFELPNQSENVVNITVGDLSDEMEVKKAFQHVPKVENEQYFLFSAIGGFISSPVVDQDYAELKNIFDLNLNSSFLLCKHFYDFVKNTSGGSICFTSAVTASSAERNKSAYGASKAALEYLVKSFSLESLTVNLTVNAIAPKIIDTPENREWVKNPAELVRPESIAVIVKNIFNDFEIHNGNIFDISSDPTNS